MFDIAFVLASCSCLLPQESCINASRIEISMYVALAFDLLQEKHDHLTPRREWSSECVEQMSATACNSLVAATKAFTGSKSSSAEATGSVAGTIAGAVEGMYETSVACFHANESPTILPLACGS